MPSPADTIPAKPAWVRAAPGNRPQRDILGVLRVQHGALDMACLRDAADRSGVRPLFGDALAGRWGSARSDCIRSGRLAVTLRRGTPPRPPWQLPTALA